MTDTRYEPAHTGLLLMDPYNDFLSEGGKAWPLLKEVATEVGLLDNLRAVTSAARGRHPGLRRPAPPQLIRADHGG